MMATDAKTRSADKRPGTSRFLRIAAYAALVVIAVLGIGLLLMWLHSATAGGALRATVVEHLRGETPEAKIEAYVDAVLRGDEGAALAAWKAPEEERDDELSDALRQRRQEVTRDLIAADLDPEYMTTRIEWWSTCCEPGPTCDSRNAGGARVHVQFMDRDGLPVAYVFDVFHQDGPYWGAAAGYEPRRWALYDVYPRGEEPLYWRWVYTPHVDYLTWPPEATVTAP
ncbi:MAG: hypothetical protein ACP5HG_09220 [Anaerolineae bacterium]